MESFLNATKSMFFHEDGSVKWRTFIGIAAGALIGGFGGLGFLGVVDAPAIGALVGGFGGLAVAQLVGMVMPSSAAADPAPPVTPVAATPPRGGQAPMPAPPGPTPPARPPAPGRPAGR